MARLTAIILFVFALQATTLPAHAQSQLSAEERADQWVKHQIGRHPDLITDPFSALTDVALGRQPSAEMGKILKNIHDALRQEWELNRTQRKRLEACGVVAVSRANDVTSESAKSDIGRGFGSIAIDSLSASKGLAKEMAKTLRKKALDKFTQDVLSELRKARPEDFKNSRTWFGHNVYMRVVWIKSANQYEFYLNGKNMKDPKKLGRWSISGSGTIVPKVIQHPDGKKEIRYDISRINPYYLNVTAECPGKPVYTNDCGDPWIGYGSKSKKPRTDETPPKCKSPPKTAAATAEPDEAQKPDPMRPNYRAVAIPDIPDEPLCEDHLEALGNQVSEQLVIAQNNRNSARRAVELIRVALDDKKPGVTPGMLEQAEQAFKDQTKIWRSASKANTRVLKKFNEAVDKTKCSKESVSEVPAEPKKDCSGGSLTAMMDCVTTRMDENG